MAARSDAGRFGGERGERSAWGRSDDESGRAGRTQRTQVGGRRHRGPVQGGLDRFRAVWAGLDRSGWSWTGLGRLGRSGLLWTGLTGLDRVWTGRAVLAAWTGRTRAGLGRVGGRIRPGVPSLA